ncbi:MAG: IS3 family transposase [Melioribacteraceae bacterium]
MNSTEIIDELKMQGHTVKNICQVLEINRSSYYRERIPQEKLSGDQKMKKYELVIGIIKQIKSEHPYWGYRRVRAYLRYRMGIWISYKLAYRLMKENGLLVDVKRYKATRVAQREKIRAEKVNQVWGTDMTKFYVDTVGWLYLVVVLDWFTKKIVGWNLSLRSKAEQWIDSLNQAVEKELTLGSREYELMLISDNGSQPTSTKYENFCNTLGINHITTSYSNPKGNADTERFFRTFKEEIIWTRDYDKYDEAKKSVEDFIEFYNNDYPHSALGYISPEDFVKQNIYSKVA